MAGRALFTTFPKISPSMRPVSRSPCPMTSPTLSKRAVVMATAHGYLNKPPATMTSTLMTYFVPLPTHYTQGAPSAQSTPLSLTTRRRLLARSGPTFLHRMPTRTLCGRKIWLVRSRSWRRRFHAYRLRKRKYWLIYPSHIFRMTIAERTD